MTRIKSGKIIIVSPLASAVQLPAKTQLLHVSVPARIFPAINEFQPGAVIFDYEYLGSEFEKILRRFKSNRYYSKIKVYCYKQTWHTRTDSLLQTLGVDEFIYADEMKPETVKPAAKLSTLSNMLENAVASNKLAEVV